MKIYNVLVEYTNFEDEDNNYSEIVGSFSNKVSAMKCIDKCVVEELLNNMIDKDKHKHYTEEIIDKFGYIDFEQKCGYGETRIILSINELDKEDQK